MVEIKAANPPLIDVSEDASEPVRFAASELRRYVSVVLGFDEGCGDDCRAVRISLGVDPKEGIAPDGFEVRRSGEGLQIVGADPSGVVNGVYAFLHRWCGCRFSSLPPDGEFVPARDTIRVDSLPYRKEPVLSYRGLQFYYWEGRELMIRRLDWMAKNGLNYVMYSPAPDGHPCVTVDPSTGAELNPEPAGEQRYSKAWFDRFILPEVRKRGLKLDFNHHNLHFWLPPGQYFHAHPEWYAMIDGERRPNANQLCLCTSNTEMVAELTNRVRDFLKENPEVGVVGIVPEDHTGMCQCDECRKGDDSPDDAFRPKPKNVTDEKFENVSKSRRYARLVEAVAGAVRDEYPKVKIGLGAYRELVFPPRDTHLPENTICWVAMHWRHGHTEISLQSSSKINRFFAETLQRWRQSFSGDLILYEYYMGLVVHRSLPYPIWETICRDWPVFHTLGVCGATVQLFGTNHEVYALNALAFARCGWERTVDPDELLSEFLDGVYGNAVSAVRPLFEQLAKAVREIDAIGDDVALKGPPLGLGAGYGLQPTGRTVAFFFRRIDRRNMRAGLERALEQAETSREKRQVAALVQAFDYWEKAADFAEFCDEAERCAGTFNFEADAKIGGAASCRPTAAGLRRVQWCRSRRSQRAIDLYRNAIEVARSRVLPACRRLTTGWFGADGEHWWEKMIGQCKERIQSLEQEAESRRRAQAMGGLECEKD